MNTPHALIIYTLLFRQVSERYEHRNVTQVETKVSKYLLNKLHEVELDDADVGVSLHFFKSVASMEEAPIFKDVSIWRAG